MLERKDEQNTNKQSFVSKLFSGYGFFFVFFYQKEPSVCQGYVIIVHTTSTLLSVCICLCLDPLLLGPSVMYTCI